MFQELFVSGIFQWLALSKIGSKRKGSDDLGQAQLWSSRRIFLHILRVIPRATISLDQVVGFLGPPGTGGIGGD